MINELKEIVQSHEKRVSWDEYFMSIAYLISCRSPSEKIKVGAVIVKDNRIVTCGYNGYPSNSPHISIHRDGHEINTIHAEQNAISDAARRGVTLEGATIYITHFPCIHCSKYIISSGIKSIVYDQDYRNDPLVNELLQHTKIPIRVYERE
jgi:dCMP deaminase